MPSGFIMTRRAHKDAAGVVVEASRPIITGNCSAGVGRTGTFIAVAITIAKLNYASTATIHGRPPLKLNFNVLDTLVQLRRQRPGMVQTKEQLIFCFDGADHQLLTNRGFMFVDEVLAAVRWRRAADGRVVVDDWRGLEVASYDAARAQLVYRTPNALVLNHNAEQRLVEFGARRVAEARRQRRQSARHRRPRDVCATARRRRVPQGARRSRERTGRRRAHAGARAQRRRQTRRRAGAAGAAWRAAIGAERQPADAVALAELYGLWLAGGAQSERALTFAVHSEAARAFLMARLAQLALVERVGGEYRSATPQCSVGATSVRVSVPAWASLFAVDVAPTTAHRRRRRSRRGGGGGVGGDALARVDARRAARACCVALLPACDSIDAASVCVGGAELRDELVALLLDAGVAATFAEEASGGWRVYYSSRGRRRRVRAAGRLAQTSAPWQTERCTTWCFDMSSGGGANDGFVVVRRARRGASARRRCSRAPLEQWARARSGGRWRRRRAPPSKATAIWPFWRR
jgi:hypothetical protein